MTRRGLDDSSMPGRGPGLPLALVALLVAPLAAAPWVRADEPPAEDAAEATAEIPTGKGRKEAKKARKRMTDEQKARERFEASGRTATEWYEEALERYHGGQYLKSREILLPLEDSPRAIDIQDKVKLLLADTYFYQGGTLNLAEALARYRSFLTFFPQSEHAEYAQFQLGESYFRQLGPTDRDQSFTDNAIAEYSKFLEVYPESEYAGTARAHLLESRARKARHAYEVALFYWEWGNYQAAADRLADILKQSPELPEREQALFYAAQANYRLGRSAEGDAYAARLAKDHPGSKYLNQLTPGMSGADEARKTAKREAKRRKETERTHAQQLARDQRRTRQIRKDSGLPARVPDTPVREGKPVEQPAAAQDGDEDVFPGEEAAAPALAPASAPAAARPAAPPPEPAPLTEEEARRREREAEKAAQEEEKERERAAIEQARETERLAKQAEKERREAEKAAAEPEDPEKAAKRAAEEAKRAEKEAQRAEKLEAEEQAEADSDKTKAEKRAEKKRLEEEKKAEEARRKAEKKAEKQAEEQRRKQEKQSQP